MHYMVDYMVNYMVHYIHDSDVEPERKHGRRLQPPDNPHGPCPPAPLAPGPWPLSPFPCPLAFGP